MTNEEIQVYLLYLLQERKLAWASCNVRFTALNHFFQKFLKRKSVDFWIPRRPRQQKLPEVLSREEVVAIIDAGAIYLHLRPDRLMSIQSPLDPSGADGKEEDAHESSPI